MNQENNSAYATIVSIYPRKLVETKPGLFPSEFVIPPGTLNQPGLLMITDDVHYLMNPDPLSDGKDVRQIKIPVRAMEAAQSIIMDYITALIAFESNHRQPGLFAIKGGYDDPLLIKTKFSKELTMYDEMQKRWFQALVIMADEIYAQTHSPAGISDMQRHALKELNLERDWLITTQNAAMPRCPFCMNLVQHGAIVCQHC